MIVAIASDNGVVSAHFGRCEQFVLFEVRDSAVGSPQHVKNTTHTQGQLPEALDTGKVGCVIAGGMGPQAQRNLEAEGIPYLLGITGPVDEVARQFAASEIEGSESMCDRSHDN